MSLSGPLPVYRQIGERLARDIAAGRLIDGERLPPEREMAEDLGVAVGTLRKALADLAGKGLLDRVQGSGNYVRAGAVASIYAMFRLELAGGGGRPTAEVLSLAEADKPAALPRFGDGPRAHRIRRLRRLDGRAAALEEIWLCASVAPRVTAADVGDSLYLFYEAALGLHVARAGDRVGQGPVPDWAPEVFGPRPGAPVPEVVRVSETGTGLRPEASFTWIDPETARYVARIR